MMVDKKLFMGLMSGTSMDGIDAAIVDLSSNTFITGITCPYSPEAKEFLNAVLLGESNCLKSYSQLNTILGKEFAKAALELIEQSQIPATAIQAIGSHGQTLCHDPSAMIPYTIQLGCAHTIAETTGITVVADFRTRDLVVGGQGAPFAPIYHQALFKEQGFPVAVVNIGGIANVTYLANEFTVSGYDLGPGNCLMDAWIHKHHAQNYDRDGAWASSGRVIESLLEKLLADPYFQRPKPKSIGKEYFSLSWLKSYLQLDQSDRRSSFGSNNLSSDLRTPFLRSQGESEDVCWEADVQATLLMLTAKSIAQGIKMEVVTPNHLFICGGGAHNSALLNSLAQLLPETKVTSTAAIQIDPDFIEASLFAWLAEKTLNKTHLDLHPITGSKRATILGAIYPAGIDKGNYLKV